MQKYSMNGMNNVEQLLKNVDLELIPKTIEKVVFGKIDRTYTNLLFYIFFFFCIWWQISILSYKNVCICFSFCLEMVSSQWDPMSTKQTKRICNVIKDIIDNYPTIDPDSKMLMLLLTNIVDRIKDSVDYDVFIPISSRQ